jgi:hypothetical protein
VTISLTVAQLVDQTIAKLMGTTRDQLNILTLNLSLQSVNYVDTVQMNYPLAGAVPGAYISIDDESMIILNTNQSSQQVSVLRGQKDSLLATHTAGAIITIDAPWPRWTVMQALQDEIRSWGPQVFQVLTTDIATQSQVRGYDLGSIEPYFRVLDVTMTPPPFIGQPLYVVYAANGSTDNSWPSVPFHEVHNADTTGFPSGNGLVIDTSNGLVIPGTLHVTYAAPFDVDGTRSSTPWGDTSDLIADVGLDVSDLDIPAYGAAWRLLSFREVRRTFTNLQGQPRDAQEVPALAIAQAAQGFKAQRDARLADAMYRLANRYPTRMSVF